jgi:hypothetical protein
MALPARLATLRLRSGQAKALRGWFILSGATAKGRHVAAKPCGEQGGDGPSPPAGGRQGGPYPSAQ